MSGISQLEKKETEGQNTHWDGGVLIYPIRTKRGASECWHSCASNGGGHVTVAWKMMEEMRNIKQGS